MSEGSALSEWTESRLLSFIRDEIEESSQLEYKAAEALLPNKTSEITKDISAFANAAGGIVIYGLSEFLEPSLKHRAEKLSPVDRLAFSKERLEHVISNVQPRMEVTIHAVPL